MSKIPSIDIERPFCIRKTNRVMIRRNPLQSLAGKRNFTIGRLSFYRKRIEQIIKNLELQMDYDVINLLKLIEEDIKNKYKAQRHFLLTTQERLN